MRRRSSTAKDFEQLFQEELAQLDKVIDQAKLSARRNSDTSNEYDNRRDCLDSLIKISKDIKNIQTEADVTKRMLLISLCVNIYKNKFNSQDGYANATNSIRDYIIKEPDLSVADLHKLITSPLVKIDVRSPKPAPETDSQVTDATIDLLLEICESRKEAVIKSGNEDGKIEILSAVDFLIENISKAQLDIRMRGAVSKDVRIDLTDAVENYERVSGKYYKEKSDNILDLVKTTFKEKEQPKYSPVMFQNQAPKNTQTSNNPAEDQQHTKPAKGN